MCMILNPVATKKLSTRKKPIKIYKVYHVREDGSLYSPYQSHCPAITKDGYIKSNRLKTSLLKGERNKKIDITRIFKGIHVYLSPVKLEDWGKFYVLLEGTGDVTDFVGASTKSELFNPQEAVFTKIKLDPATIAKYPRNQKKAK